jgi:hypothetical protein
MLLAKTSIAAGITALFSVIAAAQSGPSDSTQAPQAGDDSDPTRPVVWSLREEYYNLRGEPWNNAFLFRVDRAFLSNRPDVVGKRGILTRMDIPVIVAGRPDGTTAGLGDIYAQALLVPYLTRQFAVAGGSGIFFPTATDRRLGNGKFTIAPVALPIWFIPERGFAFLKVQDYISVAGDSSRPDLHYMTATPLVLWRFKGTPYWMHLEGEMQTNWKAPGHTAYKAGLLFGRMNRGRLGAWIKVEIGMGPDRIADFAIKTSLFRVR